MNDRDTTLDQLKERVHALCRRKQWGEDGVQNPQQVAMAMTVVDYQDTLKKPLGEKHLFYVDEMVDREGLRDTFYQVIKSYEEEGEEA